MFVDARTLDDNSTLTADLAIVGAGPAGITVARAFAGRNLRVALIESGALEATAETQALYEGESVGIDYPLAATRLRYFGGSSNHWGGFCRPLDVIDFEARDWVPHSGWPFGRDELMLYYATADGLVEVAPANYEDSTYWQRKTGKALLQLATGRMVLGFVHYGPPTHFGTRYQDELVGAGNIQILLNANVVNIAAGPNARTVTHLDVRTLTGKKHRVRAQQFVLATGGLENPRLLLLSNDVMPMGLGNQHDLVGRFFMEHPHLPGFGEIVMVDEIRLPQIFRENIPADGHYVNAAFKPTAEFMRRERLLNATLQVGVAGHYRRQDSVPHPDADKAAAHADMLRAARPFLVEAGAPAGETAEQRLGVWLGLGCACEQVPNPDSRVTLADTRDALGLRRIRLDWRLTEQDRRSVVRHMRSLALEFGALGIGRMLVDIEDDGQWPEQVIGGSHHMGTTRMHDDPKQGVVDRNCKVHDIDNLYVAGSSVFPTCGTANPTLTLVALAVRLAEHLQEKFR